jgi:hypothetical protein
MRTCESAGGDFSALNGLKSGKDRALKPWVWLHRDLFCMHSEGIDPSNRADFHRALSRLPANRLGPLSGTYSSRHLLITRLGAVLFGT